MIESACQDLNVIEQEGGTRGKERGQLVEPFLLLPWGKSNYLVEAIPEEANEIL
jgi:hypothetical protein